MDVEELLARAWGAVEKAGIPEPLQEYAFKEALARLSGDVGQTEKRAPLVKDDEDAGGAEIAPITPTDVAGPFGKFSNESGVPVDELERVYYIDADGIPRIAVPKSKLGKNSSDQAKAVAIAVTAAYDYVRDESIIGDDLVKAEAARLKIDLGGNWARVMGGIQGVGWVGAARQKQFKTNGATPEALKKVVASVLGSPTE